MTTPPHLIEQTSRSRKLARLRSYYDGTQYEGMPDFWTGTNASGEEVPMRERAPCVVYNLPKAAVRECIKFAVGEGRFPRIKVDADQEIVDGVSLSESEAADLSAFIAAMTERSEVKPCMSRAMRNGLPVGTSVLIVSLLNGKFSFQHARAEHCEPTYDDSGDLESVIWCYRFCKEVFGQGRMVSKHYYFRRDYTRTEEILYEDWEIVHNNDPEWRESGRIPHALGIVPVVWTPNSAEDDNDDIDGESIYGVALLKEFDALNLALSQRHRGIHFWGAPQPYETGVDEGDGPKATGRMASHMPERRDPYKPAIRNNRPARRSGADEIWSYNGSETKVGLIETTGKAFEVATSHVNDISSRLKEAMQVVLADPSAIAGKGEVSAKLMAMLYAPLLGHVDSLRECWWSHFLKPLISIMLRLVMTYEGRVLLPGVAKVVPILRKLMVDGQWIDPPMTPIWGVYFAPSGSETKVAVDTAKTQLEAGLITRRTALTYTADDFGVEDIDAELESAEEEAEERKEEVTMPDAQTTEPTDPTEQAPASTDAPSNQS